MPPTSQGRPGYISDKEVIQKRLRRIEGQVRGLQRMVAEDRYCINVLEQVAAVTRALQSVSLELLEDHLNHCFVLNAGRIEARSSPIEVIVSNRMRAANFDQVMQQSVLTDGATEDRTIGLLGRTVAGS